MLYKYFMYRVTIVLILSAILLSACNSGMKLHETTISYIDGVTTISISDAKVDAAEPAIAIDNEGNPCVLYVEHNPDKTADLFFHKINGKMPERIGSITRINPVKGSVKAWRGDPPTIAIARNGTIYVGWNLKVESAGKPANDLVLSVSTDGGQTFSAPVRVNDDAAPASHGMHSLLVSDDRVYVAWLDERNVKPETAQIDTPATSAAVVHHKENAEPNSEVLFSVSSDGGKTFAPNKKLASEICPCCKTSMTAAADGRIYLSWRQVLPEGFRHIAVVASADKGANFSKAVVVSDDKWKIDACPVSGATLAAGEGGSVYVVWYSAGEAGQAGVYTSVSKDGAKTFEQRRMLSADAVSGTPVMVSGGAPENPVCVFSAKDGRIVASAADGKTIDGTVDDAALPAASRSGAVIHVVFVRTVGEKRTVFLSQISARSL